MAQNKQTAGQTATSILTQMRTALGCARRLNNKKALSEDILAGNPATAGNAGQLFVQWRNAIDDIYTAVQPWALKFNDAGATDEELQQIYATVMPKWCALKGDERIFVRSNDVHRIVSFALKHGSSSKGSVDIATGKTEFRRQVETMLGIRLAQSAVLTEDDYNLISKYDKATANLDKATQRLKGYDDVAGKHTLGLEEKLDAAQKEFDKVFGLVQKLNKDIKEDDPILAGYQKTVDDLEAQTIQARSQIAKCEKTIKELGTQYKEIMGKIKEIEP